MKKLIGFCLCIMFLAGCSSIDPYRMLQAGKSAMGAASVSDSELKSMSMQMRQQEDAASKVEPENSKYTKRLKKVMAAYTQVNGTPLNYKVYVNPELNANATPDGSIRVYTGLMDAMNDDELRFVLGHEIGHVANGHALKAMRLAYATEAAKHAGAAMNSYVALAADSGLVDVGRQFLHRQYDQNQELDADSYGMNFMKEHHYNTDAAISAMRKLGNTSGGFFSTHPSSERRIQNLTALQQGADPKTLSAGN